MEISWSQALGPLVLALHLAIPIVGMLFLAIRQERQRLTAERVKLARTLMQVTRGRRFRLDK